MKRKITKSIMAILLFAVLSVPTVFAKDAPNTPIKFDAAAYNSNNTGQVVLYWTADNQGTQPDFFIIYKADKETNLISDFSRMEYVRANYNTMDYKFALNLKSGVYSFYITSMAFDGNTLLESQPTAIKTVEIKAVDQQLFISILSQPPTNAVVGKDYQYFLKVNSNINCPVDQFNFISDPPEGMTIDKVTGAIFWKPLKSGDFPVAISAGTSCKINVQPAYQKFVIHVTDGNNTQNYLKIVSTPPSYGKIGQEVIYRVQTETNVKCPVLYEGKFQPADAVKFDNQTGTITMVMQQAGVITGSIRAYLQCDDKVSVYQQFAVKFGATDPPHTTCASIYGTVNYEDGSVVPNAVVKFWLTDRNSKDLNLVAVPLKNGQYSVELPDGVYLSDVEGPLVHEYYKDAATIDKATKIELKCNDKIEINYIVAKVPEPVHYVVSGKVLSAADNSPVATIVEFIPVELMKGAQDNKNVPVNTQFRTKTDAEGNYSIKLPNTYTYYAHALQPANTMFMEQFYDKVDNQFEADILELTGDLTGIDFALKTFVKNQNGFSGTVKDDSGNPLQSAVFAYLVKNNQNTKTKAVLQTQTDQQGIYKFVNMPQGEYVVLSVPTDRTFLPGYLKLGDFTVLKWKDATKITVGDNMATIMYDIKHKKRTGLKGIIRVDGQVTDLGGTIKSSDKPQNNTLGLSGAFVYIFDENGDVSDFGFTDVNGNFSLSEVAQGGNKLIVDKPGYGSYQQGVQNDYQKNYSSNMTIGLQPDETQGIPEENYIKNGFSIYPAPANNFATLEFNSNSGSAEISILNSIGSLIQTNNSELNNGFNTITLDVSALKSGIYFIRVTINGNSTILPLNIVR